MKDSQRRAMWARVKTSRPNIVNQKSSPSWAKHGSLRRFVTGEWSSPPTPKERKQIEKEEAFERKQWQWLGRKKQ